MLPEFSLKDRVIIVSGAARGLGLTQAEALLETGAKGPTIPSNRQSHLTTSAVHALDRLPEPEPSFYDIAKRAASDHKTSLTYHQVDVRDIPALNKIVSDIAEKEGRLDGLIAAAGIQQETTALEYSAEDANRMFEVNITGVFMTAQAVARQMVKFGKGGSIVLIASMSASVANRVHLHIPTPSSLTAKVNGFL